MATNESRDTLFRPSLSGEDSPASAPYSVQTTVLTGFFGGPIAALAILACNSTRLARLPRDLPVWAALAAVVIAGAALLFGDGAGAGFRQWLLAQLGDRAIQFLARLVALVIVAIGYLMHRREQRTSDLMGLARPNGLPAGLACIAIGVVVSLIAAEVTR